MASKRAMEKLLATSQTRAAEMHKYGDFLQKRMEKYIEQTSPETMQAEVAWACYSQAALMSDAAFKQNRATTWLKFASEIEDKTDTDPLWQRLFNQTGRDQKTY